MLLSFLFREKFICLGINLDYLITKIMQINCIKKKLLP